MHHFQFWMSLIFWLVQLDARSMSLESGRYMETVGELLQGRPWYHIDLFMPHTRLAECVEKSIFLATTFDHELQQRPNLMGQTREISHSPGGTWIPIVWLTRCGISMSWSFPCWNVHSITLGLLRRISTRAKENPSRKGSKAWPSGLTWPSNLELLPTISTLTGELVVR
jgi:hypothetical protein